MKEIRMVNTKTGEVVTISHDKYIKCQILQTPGRSIYMVIDKNSRGTFFAEKL